MLIHNVEIEGQSVGVRIRDGLIADIGADLAPQVDDLVIDGQGGALLPSLHDHHIHLNATAAALGSVRCGPPNVNNPDELIAALEVAPGDEWIRAVGYHPSVAGEIDRKWLDRHGPDRPVRIQHRGGRMWIFNSRAMGLLDIDIPDDGRLVDGDVGLRKALGSQRPDLAPLVELLLSKGVTGVTEVTPGNDRPDFVQYATGAAPLNLMIMGSEDLHGFGGLGQAVVGPLKIHNHDHALPSLAELVARIAEAHNDDRAVAIHCVTRAEMMLSLAAIEDAGVHPLDRVEHAAIADDAIIEWIAKLGLTVVTQPHFISERKSAYLQDVEKAELPNLWRLKSFADEGVSLAGGSDAPFGDMNPWKAMVSATCRPPELFPEEAITPEQALALYTKPFDNAAGEPRKLASGACADLCLLDRNWRGAAANLSDVIVRATWIGGEIVYDNISSTKPHSSAV